MLLLHFLPFLVQLSCPALFSTLPRCSSLLLLLVNPFVSLLASSQCQFLLWQLLLSACDTHMIWHQQLGGPGPTPPASESNRNVESFQRTYLHAHTTHLTTVQWVCYGGKSSWLSISLEQVSFVSLYNQ